MCCFLYAFRFLSAFKCVKKDAYYLFFNGFTVVFKASYFIIQQKKHGYLLHQEAIKVASLCIAHCIRFQYVMHPHEIALKKRHKKTSITMVIEVLVLKVIYRNYTSGLCHGTSSLFEKTSFVKVPSFFSLGETKFETFLQHLQSLLVQYQSLLSLN